MRGATVSGSITCLHGPRPPYATTESPDGGASPSGRRIESGVPYATPGYDPAGRSTKVVQPGRSNAVAASQPRDHAPKRADGVPAYLVPEAAALLSVSQEHLY